LAQVVSKIILLTIITIWCVKLSIMSSSSILLLIAVLPLYADALRINQAEKKEAPKPASSLDLKRMQVNSYKSNEFRSWHEQMVKEVMGDQQVPPGSTSGPPGAGGMAKGMPAMKNMTLKEGQFACGCPVGYTYFYAHQKEKATAYCNASAWSAEPWREAAEKHVDEKCPSPQTSMLGYYKLESRVYEHCSQDKPTLICDVADEVVQDVKANYQDKVKQKNKPLLLVAWADRQASCHWAIVPEDPKV